MIYNPVTQWIASQIWLLSEKTGIGLGRLAPFVFGVMVGSPGVKKDELSNKGEE